MKKTHTIKSKIEYFEPMFCGKKRSELRINDCDYKVGDELVISEVDENGKYTGRVAHRHIIWMDDVSEFVGEGWVLLHMRR